MRISEFIIRMKFIETLKNVWKIEELRNRILLTLGLLLVYRFGAQVVLPGIDASKLAEFAGEPTEHIIIPFGKGICGQVAVSNENFVVQNVEAQDNYISCGWKVKSEIVIPIFARYFLK